VTMHKVKVSALNDRDECGASPGLTTSYTRATCGCRGRTLVWQERRMSVSPSKNGRDSQEWLTCNYACDPRRAARRGDRSHAARSEHTSPLLRPFWFPPCSFRYSTVTARALGTIAEYLATLKQPSKNSTPLLSAETIRGLTMT
jgi:hypothetical protein